MFIGRDRELQALNRLYEQKCFQMVVMYGRRRVGKTSLIREFSNDKPAVFYTATNDESIVCLKDFTRCLKEFMTDDAALQGMESFSDWNAAFDYVTRIAQKRQLILIIDEFPYLAKTYPAIMSVLQKYSLPHKATRQPASTGRKGTASSPTTCSANSNRRRAM